MSASPLANTLAALRGNLRLDLLPRVCPDADPAFVRAYLEACQQLRDGCDADLAALPGNALPERLPLLRVRAEIAEAIADARRWLRRCARRGGHGLPLPEVPHGKA